jgi:predicted acetyltransferase
VKEKTVIIREAKDHERIELFREAYKVWSKNRTFEQYCADNSKEDAFGTRYVLEQDGKILSSLILLKFKDIGECKVYGIGSVLTFAPYRGKGYATALLNHCIESIMDKNTIVILYSEINPAFYERLGFRVLPSYLQIKGPAVCMALCSDSIWKRLLKASASMLPTYF